MIEYVFHGPSLFILKLNRPKFILLPTLSSPSFEKLFYTHISSPMVRLVPSKRRKLHKIKDPKPSWRKNIILIPFWLILTRYANPNNGYGNGRQYEYLFIFCLYSKFIEMSFNFTIYKVTLKCATQHAVTDGYWTFIYSCCKYQIMIELLLYQMMIHAILTLLSTCAYDLVLRLRRSHNIIITYLSSVESNI